MSRTKAGTRRDYSFCRKKNDCNKNGNAFDNPFQLA